MPGFAPPRYRKSSRTLGRRLAWLIGAAGLVGAAAARADPLFIAIVGLEPCCPQQAWPEAERKTRAELDTLGYQARILPSSAPAGEAMRTQPLSEIVRAAHASGGVRITRQAAENQGQAELWARNPETGKFAQKLIPLEETHGNRALSLVALRISEALDACLIELGLPPPRLRALSGPAPPRRSFALAVGVSASLSLEEQDLRPGLEIAVGYQGWPWLQLEWSAIAAPLGPPLGAQGQSFSFGYAASPLWVYLTPPRPRQTVRPALGLGAGPLFAWSRIAESTLAAGQSRTTWTSYLALGGRLGFALGERLELVLTLRLATFAPGLAFQLTDQTLTRFQGPLLEVLGSLFWSL